MKNYKIIADALAESKASITRRMTIHEKRLCLNPHEIGIMRLTEVHLNIGRFSENDITRIGYCSIWRKRCIVGRIKNEWCAVCMDEKTPQNFKAYYIVKGKKVYALYKSRCTGSVSEIMDKYEGADLTRPLALMDADHIFSICKGTRFRKKTQIAANRKVVTDRKTGKKVWGTMAKREVCA